MINPLSASPANDQTHSHFSSATPTNCLGMYNHFVGLGLKGLKYVSLTQCIKLSILVTRNILVKQKHKNLSFVFDMLFVLLY